MGVQKRDVRRERGGGVARGRRKKRNDNAMATDESGESSLDSSDNDFEEQIKKLKVHIFIIHVQ